MDYASYLHGANLLMGMYGADSDRDYHDEYRREAQMKVPCGFCRAPVWVEARTSSIFDKRYCSEGCRQQAEGNKA